MTTKIEWASETVNPIIGCSQCSPGCDHCYAERMAVRIAGTGNEDYKQVITDGKWNGRTVFVAKELKKIHSGKNKNIFVCSMSDMFHESVDYSWQKQIAISQLEAAMHGKNHTYIWLTKRPKRMKEVVGEFYGQRGVHDYVIGMVTVCNQKEADEKIPILLDTPFLVRGLSIEPMLEPIDFLKQLKSSSKKTYEKINWVIVGGESGPGARTMKPNWVRSIRDQCKKTKIPFFFKQWGDYKKFQFNDLAKMLAAGWNPSLKKGGRVLDGKIHDEYPTIKK